VDLLELFTDLPDLRNSKKLSSIFDFDLRNINDKQKLMIFNLLKARTNREVEYSYEVMLNLLVNQHPALQKAIKSEREKEFMVQYGVRFMQISNKNSAGYWNHKSVEGSGVQLFGALLNHSCDSNIFPVTFENKFACVVVKPIEKDESCS
jgi:hypothetical protein